MIIKRLHWLLVFIFSQSISHAQITEKLVQKANGGNAKAQYEYACELIRYKDTIQAVNWYKKAAGQGYAQASYDLAILYWEKDDYKESAMWCAQCDGGMPWALLGGFYKHGKGVEKDFSKAAYWYGKYLSASIPSKKSDYWPYSSVSDMIELAQCYDSIGNYTDALKWYNEAIYGKFDPYAELDELSTARAIAGKIRIYHLGLGVQKDSKVVNTLLSEFNKVVGTYLLTTYAMEFALERDDEMTLFWTEYAVNCGSKLAEYWMGRMYEFGKYGVEKNEKMAFEWFQKAAIDGYYEAYLPLGMMYEKGKGVDKNYERAFKLYELILDYYKDQSFTRLTYSAMGRLGILYYYGYYVPQDHDKAYSYLRIGSELSNDSEVMRTLSSCYRYFDNVKDEEKAEFWFEKAKAYGDETAIWLSELESKRAELSLHK